MDSSSTSAVTGGLCWEMEADHDKLFLFFGSFFFVFVGFLDLISPYSIELEFRCLFITMSLLWSHFQSFGCCQRELPFACSLALLGHRVEECEVILDVCCENVF